MAGRGDDRRAPFPESADPRNTLTGQRGSPPGGSSAAGEIEVNGMMDAPAPVIARIDEVISDFGGFDLLPEDYEGAPTDSSYIHGHRHEYIRTLRDISAHFGSVRGLKVFEIGAFFGVVSIALAREGADVIASDVPEYMGLAAQRKRFGDEGVRIDEMRLEDFIIDAPEDSIDCVVMCEVLEHLNFNPLPLLKEINRILRPGGLFYLSLPNQSTLRMRLRALRGKAIGIPVDSFFRQLDPRSPEIANAHWREYTAQDIREMLEPLGFAIARQYYFSLGECRSGGGPRKALGRLFYRTFPFFKENQTTLAVKRERTSISFSIPGTVHPTLREL